MKKLLFIIAILLSCITSQAQRPFEGRFFCKDTEVYMHLNLYEETVDVPNFSFLGKMHGYMSGSGIYGTWMITKCSIKNNKATIRFSNDIGSDTQDIVLTQNADSTYSYHAVDGNNIRRAVGHKLVKVTGDMVFRRK